MEDELYNKDNELVTKGAFNGKYWNTLSLESKINFIYGLLQTEIVDSHEQPFAKTISDFMSSDSKRCNFIKLIDGFFGDKDNRNTSIVAICKFICLISDYNKSGIDSPELKNELEILYKDTAKYHNLVKDVERFHDVSKLLQEMKFLEAATILENLEENGFIKPEHLKQITRYCYIGCVNLLYARGAEYLENHDYDKAVQLLDDLRDFIIKYYRNLGLEKKNLLRFMYEI